jgi:hypothetical protein
MSQLNVNTIKNRTGTSGPVLTGLSTVSGSLVVSNDATVSGAATVSGNLSVTGNVSVGGTLTYEDVTNIDSVGVITARQGIVVVGGGITAVGVVTATSFVGDGTNLTGVASTDNIITGTAATFTSTVDITTLRATDHEGNFILDSYLFN